MDGFVCKVCGFIAIDGKAPDKCPVCGAPQTSFEEKKGVIKTAKDEAKLSEKHTPVITVVRKCGLLGDGCIDVHAKIGSVEHPTLPEHHIMHLDFYIDKDFISRIHLTYDKLHPAGALHLKVASGKISVVELCNLHGAWIGEEDL